MAYWADEFCLLPQKNCAMALPQKPVWFSVICFFVLFGVYACQSSSQSDKESLSAQALFDGQTFTGWEGQNEFFRIEDKAIVAGSMEKSIPQNEFLCTEQAYEDFELTLKVKFPTQYNNGGIQIRSRRIPDDNEVIGYQVDVGYSEGKPVWASIYDESRRNRFVAKAPEDQIDRLLRAADYNDYRIRCEGKRIQVWFNGEQVVDYSEVDDDIAQSGVICVQIHGGKPSEAWYKDIQIKEL
jgi:hypothetical protein